MTVIIKEFNPVYIIGTLSLAFFGSYACITLYEQYRLVSKDNQPKVVNSWILLLLMAFSLGGVAIWCMHFIAMSGVVFINAETREYIPIRYRVDLSLASLASVIFFSLIGLLVASYDRDFVLDEKDIVANYIEEIRRLSIVEIRKLQHTKRNLLWKTLFRNMPPILLGGTITASGVCVMHYIGMMAMVFDGHIRWNYGVIAASVLIALVAATAALWILFRLLALFPDVERLRLGSAMIAAAAVNGMHYTGMIAGEFHYQVDERSQYKGSTLSQNAAIIYSAIAATLFLWVVFLIVIADLREWYHHLSVLVRETDKLADYHQQTNHGKELFLCDYVSMRSATLNNKQSNSISLKSRKVAVYQRGDDSLNDNILQESLKQGSYQLRSDILSIKPSMSPVSGQKKVNREKKAYNSINLQELEENNAPRSLSPLVNAITAMNHHSVVPNQVDSKTVSAKASLSSPKKRDD